MTEVVDAVAASPALHVLFERPVDRSELRGRGMPGELARRYGGRLLVPLRPDRPTFVANFVSTLDGIVAFDAPEHAGGGWISGSHEPDRFVMALARAVADVVIVGAGTLRGSTHQRWIAPHLKPELADALAAWRRAMGLAAAPTTIVVTATGMLPARHPGLNDPDVPVVVATTPTGAARLRAAGLARHVAVEAIGDGAPLRGTDILGLVACRGARLALAEGGPHLLAGLVGDDLLDELLLTVAPQLAGRSGGRLGLVEGIALAPEAARWHELISVRRSDDHLFLRYGRTEGHPARKEH